MKHNESIDKKSMGKDIISYKFKTDKRESESLNP